MSFTAEWTATTGFNTSGYTVTFGKQLNQCSVDEIVAHPMCGSNHPIGNCAYVAKESTLGTSSVAMHLANAQFKDPIPNNMSNTWVCDPAPTGDNALIYRRTIFVGMPTSVTQPQYCLTDECDNRILIIEDIKAPNKLVYNYGNINWAIGAASSYRTMANQVRHTCNKGQSTYASAPSTLTYVDNTDPDNPVTTIYKICMYHVYTTGDDCFIVGYDYIGQFGGRYQNASNNYNCLAGGSNYQSFTSENGNCLFIGLNTNSTGGETNLQGIFGNDIYADPVPNPPVFVGQYITYAPQNIVLQNARLRFSMSNSTISGSMRSSFLQFDLVDAEEIRKQQMARSGIYFVVNGELFKPIISGGIVIGYGTPEQQSEIDTYTDLNHPVPSGGGGGGGGGDDDDPSDPQTWGGAYSGAGAFSKFYLCTATDLANLRTWFGGGGSGDEIPDGFDPMGQVLGLLQYPVSISGTALAAEEIVFRSGKTIVHTNVNATRSTGGFLHLDCGSVNIPRRMQERGVPFLDFETTLEIYVPFCGTAPLDVQTCVGKTLTCDLYIATATGDVSAIIAADSHPVAYMSGNMAESLPISSAGYGMYLAACKSTWGNGVSQTLNQLTGGTVSTIKNVNQAALNETLSYSQTGGWGQSELLAESYNNPAIGRGMSSLASAKGAAAIGLLTTGINVANAASTGYEQYQRVKNASYTSVSGSFTSCAAWNYPFTPYVKITRPHKQIPDNYKHTAAIPLIETKTLSGAPGLTTCVNPDVSGIANATAQEKDIIYRALVNGVIV